MNTQEIKLSKLTTMKIGGLAKNVLEISTEKELLEAYTYAKDNGLNIFPLGGGSNTIFKDTTNTDLILVMKNTGILKFYENSEIVNIEVQAGEIWDDLVDWTVEHGYKGLECLSSIPGTVGAGPIQNIGAYGSEISNTISKVKILDVESGKIFELSNSDCEFGYRDSVFKRNLGKFIIISVSFTLQKKTENLPIPQYKDVQMYFLEKKQKAATLKEIRNAIVEIREKKIPHPNEVPNCGSFFENPIVSQELGSKIARENPEMPYHKMEDGSVKLYAGWLIEKCNLKGFNFGKIKIDDDNALILTNPEGKGDYGDLEKAIKQIQAQVFEKFEIELEVEPNIK